MNDPAPLSARSHSSLLEHREFVERASRRLSSSEHDAQDLMQDTWLAALSRPPRDSRSIKGWLATVMRHRALDHRKTETRARDRERRSARPELAPACESPAEVVELRLSRERLVAALGRLEPRYREVLELRYFAGLAPPEIARRLRVPFDTVHTRHRRALARLRRELGPDRIDLAGIGALLASAAGPRRRLAWIGALLGAAAAVLPLALIERTPAPAPGASAPLAARLAPADGEATALPDAIRTESAGASVPSPEPGVRIEIRFERGSTPARALPVLVEFWDRRGERSERLLRTDGAGRARAAFAQAGLARVSPWLGEPRWLDVESADASDAIDFTLAAPSEVSGTVLDAAGAPAAGARIRVSLPHRPERFVKIAEAGADGGFHLAAVDPGSWIGAASARGESTSAQWVRPYVPSGPALPIELVVREPSRVFAGRVVDECGAPVAGALVRCFATEAPRVRIDRRGWLALAPRAEEARTDRLGAFEIGSAIAAPLPVLAVSAAGRETCVVAPDPDAGDLVLTLERSRVLRGLVLGPDGAPVAGCRVRADLPFIDSPRYACTGADGAFEVHAPDRGIVQLLANPPLERRAEELRGAPALAGIAAATVALRGQPPEPIVLVLDPAASIRGRAVDAGGAPLAGWTVIQRLPSREDTPFADLFGSKELRRATTAPDGRFALDACSLDACDLWLVDPADREGRPLAWRRDVRPGSDEIVLRCGDRTRATASLRLSVDETAPALVVLRSERSREVRAAPPDPRTGIVRFDGITPGRHELLLFRPDDGFVPIERIELIAFEERDLGFVDSRRRNDARGRRRQGALASLNTRK